jgi:hypothetical protein
MRFVVETLDRGAAEPTPAGRLWLGTRIRPRLADAQLLVDPAVEEGRRRAFATAPPPALRARPSTRPEPASAVAPPTAGVAPPGAAGAPPPAAVPPAVRRRPFLLPVLEEELGLHVGLETCHWPFNPRAILVEGPPDDGRTAVLRRLESEHSVSWAAVGPHTVRLAPNRPHLVARTAPWGVAAVPLGADPLRHKVRASQLDLQAVAAVEGPPRTLFAVGRWEELEKLMAATASQGSPAPSRRGSSSPR